jgi:Lsr2
MEGKSSMVQRVQVLLVDDLDGGTAEETVSFSIDGRSYEIDLNATNATELRQAFTPYQENARRARSAGRKTASRAANSRERSAEIREWARSAGIPVNERGRIPVNVIERYEAAH